MAQLPVYTYAQTDELCTFCADGSGLNENFADVFIPPEQISPPAFFTNNTCTEINDLITEFNVTSDDDPGCAWVQLDGYYFCGCDSPPVADDGCTLCADGSLVTDRDLIVPFYPSCVDFQTMLTAVSSSPSYCIQQQLIGFHSCGCPTLPSQVEDPCQVCPFGLNNANADRQADGPLTCEMIYEGSNAIPASSEQCAYNKQIVIDHRCCIRSNSKSKSKSKSTKTQSYSKSSYSKSKSSYSGYYSSKSKSYSSYYDAV